ncbi:DNA replication/repair protein RecF [Donghicola sp. C2-DW-16]|uniref:DNA replication and repair protein RecF n=1 Tax=Donghicola mangrovi TaxID=2729614 RepID=A0ABX2P923_9RHOB|nr:DNA replication/repair protein RecF [Donghicola mangrovi]NVO25945.1 DNA replication/repair protein RecF [Donghicola mangrovi]
MKGLFLSHLRMSHFRSHRRAELFCDGRPVALYGSNGAGKTNILEAVSLFSPGRGMRRASAEEMARRPESLGWKLVGAIEHGADRHEAEIWSENGAARQLKLNDKAATQLALGQIARVLWLVPSMDRLWIEGAEGRRRFLDRMVMSFFPAHAEASLIYEKAMRERNRLLKDQRRDAYWYGALEAQMAQAGAQIMEHRRLALALVSAAQREAETAFPVADLELVESEPIEAEGLAQAFADSRGRDLMAGRTLVGPHRTDLEGVYAAKSVPAKDCSTGEQKALLISLILANARALAQDFGAPPILLLDEVSAHLDANRRAALYDEVCALGAQAWMTGTGLELFEEFKERAQYFEVSEEAGISRVEERFLG